ncbi:MAG: thiamine diphosphokinase [Chloroflexota bacterium]
MRALVVADGDHPTSAALDAAWPGWDVGVDLVVAADGGARLADALGLTIDRWVGDGDSLGPDGVATLRDRGVAIDLASTDKDQSDAELGLLAVVAAGATEITLLGALGGPRPDHALANVALLGHPAASGLALEILDPRARIRLLDATAPAHPDVLPVRRLDLSGRIGDLVSLIPLHDVTGASSTGLQFPLDQASLPVGPSRSLSNVRTQPIAEIAIRTGRLLVIEAPATFSP